VSLQIPQSSIAEHLAAIIESSDDVIVSKTLEGIITSWNPAAERILGYTAQEAVGRNIKLIIPPERWAEEDEVLARIRRGEKVDHFETIRRTKDGRLLNISLTVSPVRNADGRIVGASKVARDITDRKRLEEERDQLYVAERAARHEAEQASRLKDEFLAVVSHELRNPLNAITGWASLIYTGRIAGDQMMRATQTILRNAQSLNRMIGDLLDVSRIVSGRMRLELRPVELATVIDSAIEVIRPAAEAKGVRLEASLERPATEVAGDPDRLQQVMTNLLSNALKFTPNGGRIQVELHRVESHAEIVVKDTGIGIELDLLPYIFERFRQGDTSTARKHGGLGLGLAIARHIVELHGGIISARSDGIGMGAEFTIQLPLPQPAEESALRDREAMRTVEAGATPLPSLKGLRVMVVDDEADAREVVTAVLIQAGAEVAPVGSSSEAMDLIARWRPEVMVSDIGMPGEDGYALIRKVRALGPGSGGDIPAVALTAFARTHDRLKILSSGYQMHVPKPVEPMELATVVASLTKRL
jgi:PAS domain S-box-containing protein